MKMGLWLLSLACFCVLASVTKAQNSEEAAARVPLENYIKGHATGQGEYMRKAFHPDAKIMFIGEGPGENEDLQGRPFVGRAGELLNTMIGGMGLSREQVFIANIVKCRPPGNREPGPDEVATCTPYLERQIEIIRPKVIVTLGRPAAQHARSRAGQRRAVR